MARPHRRALATLRQVERMRRQYESPPLYGQYSGEAVRHEYNRLETENHEGAIKLLAGTAVFFAIVALFSGEIGWLCCSGFLGITALVSLFSGPQTI